MKKFLSTVLLFVGLTLQAFSQDHLPQYVDLPECNRSEARMLRAGIIAYVSQYPDSTKSTIFDNLRLIDEFIKEDSKDTLELMSFKQLPMRVIDHIEQTYFNKNIYTWTPKVSSDNSMYQSNLLMLKTQQEQIDKYLRELKNKISFQCKWFKMLGLPCNEY